MDLYPSICLKEFCSNNVHMGIRGDTSIGEKHHQYVESDLLKKYINHMWKCTTINQMKEKCVGIY